MNNYNQMIDLANSGTSQLLSYLEKLKSQAEDLLRGVRGINDLKKNQNQNPVNTSLQIRYEKEVLIDKEEFIKETKLINDTAILIIYSDNQYVLHDLLQNKPISTNKFPSQNYNNIQVFPPHLLKQFKQSQDPRSYEYLIAYFDLTFKGIAVYDLFSSLPVGFISIQQSMIEDSFTFKIIEKEIVATYKKGDIIEEQDDSQINHSYEVYELIQNQDNKINWNQKIKNVFSLQNYYSDKSIILKNKTLILYNSFTSSHQKFSYYVYQDNNAYIRRMKNSLEGQVLDVIEYQNSNKIGFLINTHTGKLFKLFVHDLDQQTEYTENELDFQQIPQKVLVTQVFCFIDDRYIGLQFQNIQYGAKNVLYDIENQQILCILNGSSIVDCNNKVKNLRMLMHNDEEQLENQNLKLIYFTKQSILLMKYLEEQGILKQYGEQACKEIIEMIVQGPALNF